MLRRLVIAGFSLAAVVLGGAPSAMPIAGAASGGDVTMTVGLLQDMSSPNVAIGYLVPEFDVWNLQYATLTDKAADDFATDPRSGRVVGGLRRRADLHVHLREGLQWSDGEPLTADDVAYTINRSRDEEWPNHYATVANLEADGHRRPHRRAHQLGARPEAADDGRVHRAQSTSTAPMPRTSTATTRWTAWRRARTR